MKDSDFESLRQSFYPSKGRVSLLFVGESRPHGGTFFYSGNSNLARYTQEAFARQYGPFATPTTFLKRFSALGCYLLDLCHTPVNGLTPAERREACRAGESALARTLAKEQPSAIIVVKGASHHLSRAPPRKRVCSVSPTCCHFRVTVISTDTSMRWRAFC